MESLSFLNVDLKIESAFLIDPILEEFGNNVEVLYSGGDGCSEGNIVRAVFEIYHELEPSGPNEYIAAFCDEISSFSGHARESWDKSSIKVFDIGFSGGTAPPRQLNMGLSNKTLSRVVNLGASIQMTLYAADIHQYFKPPQTRTQNA